MIKYVVAFRFKPSVTPTDRNRLLAELNDFPNRFET